MDSNSLTPLAWKESYCACQISFMHILDHFSKTISHHSFALFHVKASWLMSEFPLNPVWEGK